MGIPSQPCSVVIQIFLSGLETKFDLFILAVVAGFKYSFQVWKRTRRHSFGVNAPDSNIPFRSGNMVWIPLSTMCLNDSNIPFRSGNGSNAPCKNGSSVDSNIPFRSGNPGALLLPFPAWSIQIFLSGLETYNVNLEQSAAAMIQIFLSCLETGIGGFGLESVMSIQIFLSGLETSASRNPCPQTRRGFKYSFQVWKLVFSPMS